MKIEKGDIQRVHNEQLPKLIEYHEKMAKRLNGINRTQCIEHTNKAEELKLKLKEIQQCQD